MMRAFGFVAVLAVAGIGLFAYQRSLATVSSTGGSPQQQIDTVGVKTALLSMGEAERRYFTERGAYGTLAQLAEADLLPGGDNDRRGYHFSAATNGDRGFTITASPTESGKGMPSFVIDESMTVVER